MRFWGHKEAAVVVSEATRARLNAQAALAGARRDLERTRAETPYFADLGRRLAVLREQNHILANFRENLRHD